MKFLICTCRDCRLGDQLPDHLQGIPGARQLTLIGASNEEGKINMALDPCRDACAVRCAEVGDPPCYDVVADQRYEDPTVPEWSPCDDCRRECGVEIIERQDPDAAVRPLI